MEIVLYDCHWQQQQKKSKWLKRTGYGLVIVSLTALILFAGPLFLMETRYQLEKKSQAQSQENYSPPPSLAVSQEANQYGVDTDFSLVIPKIKAAAKIIPNVNPVKEKEYQEALKQGVGHALGTAFPGEKRTIYLFAHSTDSLINVSRYNAIFYLLKELTQKDKIIVFFHHQKFVYEVRENFITSAQDIQWLTENQEEERLILQTCWPPGTALKRLVVIAKPEAI